MSTPEIDILVVYTGQANSQSGDIEAVIYGAEGETNQSFNNSIISANVNVVHTAQVSYTESDNILIDLCRLTGSSSYTPPFACNEVSNLSAMDEVHSLRDQYGADLVVLLVSSGGAGIGWINSDINLAFSVVRWDLAIGNKTFAHEIGHNLGAQHDRGTDQNPYYNYGHGYRYSPANWRTIMSYAPGTRLNYWSNPSKTLGGIPMGTTQFEDNARVWGERASIVASFKTATPQFDFEISGGNYFNYGSFGMWAANVSNGASPYNFTWYISYTSSSGPWNTVGTGSNYSQTVTHDMWLKLHGTDANLNSHEEILKVNVLTCSNPPCPMPKIVGQELETEPDNFEIAQNYPNPFNPNTNIRFNLPEKSSVSIKIFNTLGQVVAILVEEELEAGSYSKNFEASNLASGFYLARIEALGISGKLFFKSIKMQLIK